jgi:ligand-binding sensor domain-containing protein
MVKRKVYKVVATLLIMSVFPLVSVLAVQYSNWRTFTSTAQVRYVDYFDDTLHVMTSGGYLKIDPSTLEMTKITNDDGLGTNDLYYILKDSSGEEWLAGYGRLLRKSGDEYRPYVFFDRNNNLLSLYCLADDSNQLWIGTSAGLALFSKNVDGGQIEDLYSRFGDFNPEPAVYDILIMGDTIWIATSSGLAVADKSRPDLLKSFVNWKTFNSSNFPELIYDTVSALAYYHNQLYVGTKKGAYYLSITDGDTSFVRVPTRATIRVNHMRVMSDKLYIYATGGYFIVSESGTAWGDITSFPNAGFVGGYIVPEGHWIGMQYNGLYYGEGANFSKFDDGGLLSNDVTAVYADDSGRVGACFRSFGAAKYENGLWTPLTMNIGSGAVAVVNDKNDGTWVGTWGNGLNYVNGDTSINYDETNSTLRGVLEGPSYVVVSALATDGRYLYIDCYRALDGNPVSIVDLNNRTRWISFGIGDGITTDQVNSIDVYGNNVAIGTDYSGVYYLYLGDDPFSKGDDSTVNFREDNFWLGSNNVNTVRFDNDGVLWVGTKYGLSRYDDGIERFVNIVLPDGFGPEVTHLFFDRRDNIWIGARNGLARYDAAKHSIEVFNILNSGLADNLITALSINPITNDLWIGTPSGISVLKSNIGTPTTDAAKVIAFPNPFIIRSSNDVLTFNYQGNATVRIFTPTGDQVRELDVNIPWDGTNQEGKKAVSGVYFFLLTASDGAIGKGKILLVRQ